MLSKPYSKLKNKETYTSIHNNNINKRIQKLCRTKGPNQETRKMLSKAGKKCIIIMTSHPLPLS